MEYIIVAIFAYAMLSTTVCKGQESVLSDTTYIVLRNDTVFQVKQIVYNTGKKIMSEDPIGRDTASVLRELRQQAYNLAQQYATALLYTENEPTFRRTINGFSSAINGVVGRSYFEDLDKIVGIGDSLVGTYNLRINGANPVAATIIRNNQNALRLRVNNTNYPIEIYSELLFRVRNFYDGAAKVDFYLVRPSIQGRRWTGGNRRYVLTKTN